MVNHEIRNRIRLSVAAYAYEIKNDSIMSDHEFDALAATINPLMETGNPQLDEFFRTEFVSFSGVWIHSHPEPEKLERLYAMLKKKPNYDLTNNHDLFDVIKKREPPFRTCSRCGKNTAVPITAAGACCC